MIFDVKRVCGIAFLAVAGLTVQAGEAGLERQFREPPANTTRPCVALTLDASRADGEWAVRQIERARDVGAGGVLLGVPVADEQVWKTLADAANRARQLKLDMGLRDFFLSEEEMNALPRARRLVWTSEDMDFGDAGVTNVMVEGAAHGMEIARLAVPAGRPDVLSHQVVDLAAGPAPTGGVWRVTRFMAADAEPRLVDPFDRAAVPRHVNQWLSACQERFGRTYGDTLFWYQLPGSANTGLAWPKDLPEEFPRRSGLGLIRHLPALAGVAVGGEATAAYVRQRVTQTTREMWRERFGRTVDELVHEAGLQAGGVVGEMPVEPVEAALYFKRPTFVAGGGDTNVLAAGGARVMGRRQVIGRLDIASVVPTPAAVLWPFPWKHEADRLLADGATCLLLETGGGLPGEEGAFRQMQEGCMYLRRCQVMLQQGEPVADVLVWADRPLPALAGYSCDYANDVMLETASVQDGKLRFGSGREYGVLAVDAGKIADKQVKQLTEKLAARGLRVLQIDSASAVTNQATAGLPVPPDFEWRSDAIGLNVRFLHRKVSGYEVYFVVNDSAETGVAACTFRDAGNGTPFRWEPMSGEIGAIEKDVLKGADGRVTAELFLAPHDACFVVFKKGA